MYFHSAMKLLLICPFIIFHFGAYTQTFNETYNNPSLEIDLTEYEVGMYIITIHAGDKQMDELKLIKK